MAAAEGIALLSSSAAHDIPCKVAKRRQDQLSLFTSYLIRGLTGTKAPLKQSFDFSLCAYVGRVLAASRA